MPALEIAQEEGTLVRWMHSEGARVRKGEPLMEIETDKAIMEIEAPESGVLGSLSAQAGQKVKVGSVIGLLLTEQEYLQAQVSGPVSHDRSSASRTSPSLVNSKVKIATVESGHPKQSDSRPSDLSSPKTPVIPKLTPASPKARRLAAERGIEISALAGSGSEVAVVAGDVNRIVKPPPQAEAEYRVVPPTRMRAVIAERMQRSYQEAPHIALTLSVDMSEVQELVTASNRNGASSLKSPLRITSVLVKVIATTLLKFPILNAHLVNGELREYNFVHLGIAVAVENGLLVPTIRNAHAKGLATIQSETDDLFARARAGRLRLDEIKGSTFTVSNLGMFGIEQFTAILNRPEVAILSVGTIKETPVVVNGQVVVRPIMRATINVDHRAIDGAVAAKFIAALKEILENPQFSKTEVSDLRK
jgi:pyruvate dehydrogenase E2 component (dihydrolipoamide acetyltransferase)